MDIEFESQKSKFANKIKAEKETRKKQQDQQRAASKIWHFYVNQRLCSTMLQELLQQVQPKINTLILLEQLPDKNKFFMTCNQALTKFPLLLRPLILLNSKNAQKHLNFIKSVSKVISAALSHDDSNIVKNSLRSNSDAAKCMRFFLFKCISLLLLLCAEGTSALLAQILEHVQPVDTLIQHLLRSRLALKANIPKQPHAVVFLVEQKIVTELFCHLLNHWAAQPNLELSNLAYDIMDQSHPSCRLSDNVYRLAAESSAIKHLQNERILQQHDYQLAERIYQNLLKRIQSQPACSQIYRFACILLPYIQLGVLNQIRVPDYRKVEGRQLRKIQKQNKEYGARMQAILQIRYWTSSITEYPESPVQVKWLSSLLYTLMNYSVQFSQEFQNELTSNRNVCLFYTNAFRLYPRESIEQMVLHIYILCGQFDQLDDHQFKDYIVSQKLGLKELAQFYLDTFKDLLVSNQQSKVHKHFANFLRELFERNSRIHFVDWSVFEDLSLISIPSVLRRMPYIIPFQARIAIFNDSLAKDKQHQQRGPQHMYVIQEDGEMAVKNERVIELIREQEWFDAFNQIQNQPEPLNLKKSYHIKFINKMGMEEVGMDAGGLTKEFVTKVVNQLFSPELKLFIATSDYSMIPDACGSKNLGHYKFAGKMIGKAIYEGILIEQVLNPVFLNLILKISNGINDFRYYGLQEYNSICQLRKNDVSDYGLTFSVTDRKGNTVDLIANGQEVAVTNENKNFYLSKLAEYQLNTSIQAETDAFREGLESIIEAVKLRMFSKQELQLLISGKPAIDMRDLRQYTQYKGYNAADITIQHFWMVLDELSYEDQGKFLMFVTSCSRMPTLGFKTLDPPFMIQKLGANRADRQKLPTASTCFNILKLPDYQDKEMLRAKLLYAIRSNTGFDLT